VGCGYAGIMRYPLAEALLAHALRMLTRWLPRLHAAPGDAEPRLGLMLAALLCGQGSHYVGGGLAQALSHAAGPRSSVSNGVIEALLLPHAMRFNAPVTGDGLALIAETLDSRPPAQAAAGTQAITVVERFLADAGVPARLRDVGLTAAALTEVADHAMADWAITQARGPAAARRTAARRLVGQQRSAPHWSSSAAASPQPGAQACLIAVPS
jgi:alcohol dehydrogenase class IV